MRELVLKMSMTLDGFVCGPAGEADWIFGTDQAAKAWVLQTVWNASLHIMGSRSFQDMAGYLANVHHAVRRADEPDPQGGLFQTGTSDPEGGRLDEGTQCALRLDGGLLMSHAGAH